MKAPLAASPPMGVTAALMRAIFTPCSYACFASSTICSVSRVSARDARIVRTALKARSTDDDISPTRCCALVVALRILRALKPIDATAIEIISKVSSKRIGSMIAMATTEPTKIKTPPAASTNPWVSTARKRVVSEPTRETRSPVRRRSYSTIGRRSMRVAN